MHDDRTQTTGSAVTPGVRTSSTETRTTIRPNGGSRVPVHETESVRYSDRPLGSRPDARYDMEIPPAFNLDRDRVRWSAIWAGLLTALTTMLLLSLLGGAIGLTGFNAATAAAQGNVPADAGRNSALWAGVSGLIAFLLGGWVTGRSAAVFHRGWGAVNGLMVFFLAVPITLWLGSQGLGSLVGALGNFTQMLNPGQLQGAANTAQTNPTAVGDAAARLRDVAWGTLLGLGLGIAASALGGFLGTRRELEIRGSAGDIQES